MPRGKHRGCNLIKEGLEHVVVLAINDDDLAIELLQGAGGCYASASGSYDHRYWFCLRHPCPCNLALRVIRHTFAGDRDGGYVSNG